MKILIIGGHFTPALAVIEKLPRSDSVIYVGRKHPLEGDSGVSLEYMTITARGIPFVNLITGRLQRKFTQRTIPSLFKVPTGFLQAAKILRTYKPDVILSFGGYLSVPICFSAKMLAIPIVIHEQTLRAGLANRVIANIAESICISWDSSKKFFPAKKIILTGNPLIQETTKEHCSFTPDKKLQPLLVIIGGSSGSHTINILIEDILAVLLKHYTVIHQIGDATQFGDFERLVAKQKKLDPTVQKRYHPYKFIPIAHISCILREADIVVSRAGINTITTLLLLKKPTLCIPLPVSQQDEQKQNALLLKKAGLAEVLDQSNLTGQILFDNINQMIKNKKRYSNGTIPFMLVNPMDAAKRIIEVIHHAAQKSKQKKV